jgi:hypothetical protein
LKKRENLETLKTSSCRPSILLDKGLLIILFGRPERNCTERTEQKHNDQQTDVEHKMCGKCPVDQKFDLVRPGSGTGEQSIE